MKACRVCGTALGSPDYEAPPPAVTSLSTRIEVPTVVWVCRACGHIQSSDLPDVQAFYNSEYRISLQSTDHDQLYEMRPEGPLYRTQHQAELVTAIGLPNGAKILDFGAGKAATTRRLLDLRPDLRPYVFDVSEDYRPYWTDWVEPDAQATYEVPHSWERQFDIITAHFVLEHVAAPVEVLTNLAGYLAPHGSLFFTVPDPISNPGDMLVVDHISHFVPSSIHAALAGAGLHVVSLRQDLFRGAHVVVAKAGLDGGALPNPDPAPALALLTNWKQMLVRLSTVLARPDLASARIAIYGAGFYGALIAPFAGARLIAFLDRNPHLQGGSLTGRPILDPAACPPVDLILVALNPARARDILASDVPWLSSHARLIFLDESSSFS